MTSTKFLRYFFTALFSFGAITLIGVLSFSGMLYLSGSLAAAVASTVLAVLIEGEIYRRNVLGGTGMILSFGQFLVRDNYCDQLKILAKDENARGNCNFLQDYYNLRKHLHTLSHAKKLSASQRQSQQRTEKSLAKMEDFFIRYINDTLDSDNGSEQNLSRDMDNQFKAEKTTIRATLANTIYSKKVWLWLTSPITVAGGVMAFFVAASQLAEAFAALGLVSSSLMLAVWPVAGLAAVGFMLMTYNTFVDIIHHQKWRKNW